MASHSIVILSSSPPRQFQTCTMSSSPLPSPSEIFRKHTGLRTGSNAVPMQQNGSASFTTASSLLRKSSIENTKGINNIRSFKSSADIYDVPDEGPRKKVRKTASNQDNTNKATKPTKARKTAVEKDAEGEWLTKPRKPRTQKNAEGSDVDEEKAASKSRTKKAIERDAVKVSRKPKATKDGDALEGEQGEKAASKFRAKKADEEHKTLKEKANRKPRAKKADETQGKLPSASVTKASMTCVSKQFTKSESVGQMENPLDYGLVEAVKRRTDWTPPKPTIDPLEESLLAESPPPAGIIDGTLTPGSYEASAQRSNRFGDLLRNFGFKGDPTVAERALPEGVGVNKRKLIELVKSNVPGVPKKRARTITGLATSAYAQDDKISPAPAPILQYFSVKTNERVTDPFKIPGKPRSKSLAKRAAKGKGTAQVTILLSPESALKKVSDQKFVFGTSSQLARENSPSLLRDLHFAMQVSNEIDSDDPFADSSFSEPRVSAVPGSKVSRNLWSEASRNSAGGLQEVEIVDLADSPAVSRPLTLSTQERIPPAEESGDSDVWHEIDEVDMISVPLKSSSISVGPIEAAIRAELLSSPLGKMAASPKAAKSTSPADKVKKALSRASSQFETSKNEQMPNYYSYTDAQLAKEIASYRFKPVKKRLQMISLLESCWESKQRIVLGALGTNRIVSSSPKKSSQAAKEKAPPSSQIASKKRPRGRPRKDSTASSPAKSKTKPEAARTVEYLEMDNDTPLSRTRTPKKKKPKMPAEDITDSEIAATPSPPKRSQIRTPLALINADSLTVDTPDLSPASSQTHLFKHIARAIKSLSPSKDPKNPTWHEKILLYDPIVLEDLTVWLNTGALEKVGWDGEVEPKEVKKWCESKSICCLWRENLRGGARSRY